MFAEKLNMFTCASLLDQAFYDFVVIILEDINKTQTALQFSICKEKSIQ